MQILDAGEFIDSDALASFLGECQFKFGGIAKAPGERSGTTIDFAAYSLSHVHGCADPYHTYMAIAAVALYPPRSGDESWHLPKLNALWNTTEETAQWIRDKVHRETE